MNRISGVGASSKYNLSHIGNTRTGKLILDNKRLSIELNYNRDKEAGEKGSKINHNKTEFNFNIHKFIIVYDPYVFLPKFIES